MTQRQTSHLSSWLAITLVALITLPQNVHARRAARFDEAAVALQRPLILGASVSSGFLTEGPGDRAAARYTSPENITNQARNGESGRECPMTGAASLRGYSSIIAVDFLFWDSTGGDVSQSVRALRALIASAAYDQVPLVLGDIPPLLSSQVDREILNREIYANCRRERRCYILPLDRLHQIASTTGVMINGERYMYSDLTIDGMHVNDVGSEYIANMIVRALRSDRGPRR